VFDLPSLTGVAEVVVNEETVIGHSAPLLIYEELKETPASAS
jgi:ATP-dependent protease Clp ATPase subunit